MNYKDITMDKIINDEWTFIKVPNCIWDNYILSIVTLNWKQYPSYHKFPIDTTSDDKIIDSFVHLAKSTIRTINKEKWTIKN